MPKPKGLSESDYAIACAAMRRLRDGKSISAGDRAALQRYEEARDAEAAEKSPTVGGSLAILPTRVIAEIFGVTIKTIADWSKRGLQREAHGAYDMRKVLPWWLSNIYSGAEDGDASLIALKKRYWIARATSIEIKNRAARGEYIRLEEAKEFASAAGAAYKTNVRGLAGRLPLLVAGKEPAEVAAIVREEADRALYSAVEKLEALGSDRRRKRERAEAARKARDKR